MNPVPKRAVLRKRAVQMRESVLQLPQFPEPQVLVSVQMSEEISHVPLSVLEEDPSHVLLPILEPGHWAGWTFGLIAQTVLFILQSFLYFCMSITSFTSLKPCSPLLVSFLILIPKRSLISDSPPKVPY